MESIDILWGEETVCGNDGTSLNRESERVRLSRQDDVRQQY